MGLNFDSYNPIYDDQDKSRNNGPNGETTGKKSISDKKNKKENKDKKDRKPNKLLLFFSDSRVRNVVGIAFLLFAAFVLISAISYFFNGPADQSSVVNNDIMTNAGNKSIQNDGGPVGAVIAELLFNQGFGIGSFFLLYLVTAVGLRLIGKYRHSLLSTTLFCLVATITSSSIAGLLSLGSQSFFLPGGYHGHYLSEFLMSVIGIYGTIFVNIFLVAIMIALCINALKKTAADFRAFRERRRKAEEEARKREEEENNISFAESSQSPQQEETTPRSTSGADINKEEKKQDSGLFDSTPHLPKQPAATATTNVASSLPDIKMTVKSGAIEEAESITQKPFDPTAELSRYKFPSINLLKEIPAGSGKSIDMQEQEENKARITKTLNDYDITIRSIEVCVGPTVTLYEIIPTEGIRIAKIRNLENDIAMSLAATGIRIIAPIPGKGTIGIEVPNKDPQTVWMRSIVGSRKFQECKYDLPIALGSTISNDVFIADLAKMPHVLVAGATGQGKSVGMNAIITSLLYKKHPSELKFVMIDPKMVEFSPYAKLEHHYIAKLPDEEDCIITDMTKVVPTLNSLVIEMENRYLLMKEAETRNIKEYNAKFISRRLNPEKGHRYMPYIVVLVDEFADLIMSQGKEVETPIARLAQKARAVGIHVILATQRPSTNVITGIIKANFPARIAFKVAQMVDSRTIIDRPGAEQLIGRGDMLISINGGLTRVQCAFVDTPEVEEITKYINEQPGFPNAYELPEYVPGQGEGGNGSIGGATERDPLFEQAAEYFISSNNASTSSLQRLFSIGYNRAGRIMDQLEAAGVIGPSIGAKPRQVLMDSMQLADLLHNSK